MKKRASNLRSSHPVLLANFSPPWLPPSGQPVTKLYATKVKCQIRASSLNVHISKIVPDYTVALGGADEK